MAPPEPVRPRGIIPRDHTVVTGAHGRRAFLLSPGGNGVLLVGGDQVPFLRE